MILEEFEEGEKIFDFGDFGDKFYIILQGQVGVDVPIKTQISAEEKS